MSKIRMKSDQPLMIGDKTKVLKADTVYNLPATLLKQLPEGSYAQARETPAKGKTNVKSKPAPRKTKKG